MKVDNCFVFLYYDINIYLVIKCISVYTYSFCSKAMKHRKLGMETGIVDFCLSCKYCYAPLVHEKHLN